MKKIRNLLILTVAATLMASCGGLNKMKKNAGDIRYDVEPPVLETHGGMVAVTIKGTFPDKYFDKKTTLTATPVLTYAGGQVPFDQVQILQGEKVMANNRVINYSGGNFTYNSAVPYMEHVSRTGTIVSMKESQLILNISAVRGSKSLDFDPIKLADGTIATSMLVERYAKPIIMPDNFQRIIPETGVAEIPYIINRSDLQSSTLRAEDILALKQYINDVNEDPNREFKTTVVSSYASPEGPLSLNERLSVGRGSTADKFIRNEFKDIEVAQVAGFFDEKITAEDWDGFRTELEKSNIRDKDLILRVLSMYSDPIVREREIKNMSAAYDVLKTDILPQLRRSRMVVNVDKIGRSDAQILAAIRDDASVLDLEEMLYAATLTNDMNEQLRFYQIAAEAFPTCIRAQNNIGSTLLAMLQAGVAVTATGGAQAGGGGGARAAGGVNGAIAAFDRAKAIQNNDIVKNNLGMASMVRGDIVQAEEYFTSMTASIPESRWALGVIAITKGQYDQAINYFGSDANINHALALILKGDYNRAKTMLDGMPEPEKERVTFLNYDNEGSRQSVRQEIADGKLAYLKAVVGARLDDRNYMFNALRAAVAADANWKAYAKTDLEFAKFFNDDTFRSIIQ